MPTDKMEVSNLTFVGQATGQETRINTIATLTITTDDTSQYEPIKTLECPKEIIGTFEIKDMKILRDILFKSFTVTGTIEEIAKEVFLNTPLGHEVVDLDFKQNRTHRKKRINKKWKKKYGYTCKVFYAEG